MPPEVPEEINGYIHVGWSEPLENIRQYTRIHAVYERAFTIGDTIAGIGSENGFTVERHMNEMVNTLKFDGEKIYVDAYGQDPVYLASEEDVLYVIDRYEFDDYTDWHKSEWIGVPPDLEDWMLIDILSLQEEMFAYSEGTYTLDQSDYDELFEIDIDTINAVALEIDAKGMHFRVSFYDGNAEEVFVYHINETSVELPEYIEE